MPGIKAFVAAVFGGIGSIQALLIGGVFLGVIENLTKAYISSQLSERSCIRCPDRRTSGTYRNPGQRLQRKCRWR